MRLASLPPHSANPRHLSSRRLLVVVCLALSAGVTLACALVSLFSGRPVRDDVAMTGELSLRGLVLPVGGVKEKLLAARQAGMAAVLIPARNMADVEADLPPGLRTAMEVLPCSSMEDVLASAFAGGFPLLSNPVPSRL